MKKRLGIIYLKLSQRSINFDKILILIFFFNEFIIIQILNCSKNNFLQIMNILHDICNDKMKSIYKILSETAVFQ